MSPSAKAAPFPSPRRLSLNDLVQTARTGEPPARPLTLFDPPQPVEVLALAPDGPPARFRWRRKMHESCAPKGRSASRRIGLGFRNLREPTRDYYRVEDVEGRRFWLFRRGLYECGDDKPRWFLHGLFA